MLQTGVPTRRISTELAFTETTTAPCSRRLRYYPGFAPSGTICSGGEILIQAAQPLIIAPLLGTKRIPTARELRHDNARKESRRGADEKYAVAR